MTARERVATTKLLLGAGTSLRALAWGAAVVFGLLAVLSMLAPASPALQENAKVIRAIVVLAGIATVCAVLWRSRHVASSERVALWLEEKTPELDYALVTAVETPSPAFHEGLEKAVERHETGATVRRALALSVGRAIGAAILAAALLYVVPSSAFGGGGSGLVFPGGAATGATPDTRSRLEGLTIEVTPPSYTRERARILDDPSTVNALAGSRIVVRGSGTPTGIAVSVGTQGVGLEAARRGWASGFTMPGSPAALTLRDRNFERIIVLDPRADEPPRVVLESPARDSTLRTPALVLQIGATASDDIGLGQGFFEYLITTGSGEVFSARAINTSPVTFNGARRGTFSARLDLATLRLGEGDVLSIRAVVQDENTLSGPGLATSDTRTYRIARSDEYDSVAVDPAGPLPIDSSALSQRMLIAMTEQLVREQPNLTRQELVRRSTEIGDLEDRIRKRVHEILFDQETAEESGDAGAAGTEEHDHAHSEEAVPAHNSDLFEAYNALWEAVRSLQIAEPEPALPPMRVALKALDRARLANRLYLRGLPPKIIVDLARVRMTGKDKGAGSTRTALGPADTARAKLERRFNESIELIAGERDGAVRAFTLLQVEALATSPSFASAVGEVLDAFRRGRDATLPLLRARRALFGEPETRPGLPEWSGSW